MSTHAPFDEKLVQRVLDTAAELGYSNLHMGQRRRPRRQLHQPASAPRP